MFKRQKSTRLQHGGRVYAIIPDLNIFLGDALAAIEESAKGTETERDFKGLFAGMDFNNSQILGDTVPERNKYIVKILDGIASMDLGGFSEHSIDVFGDAYEFLMTMYASNAGKSGGEFFTPQQVSRLLALIATRGKKKIANVYDPACGSGSLLMQVAKVIGKDNVTDGFYGQETEPTTHRLCRMNLFLHGIFPHKFDIHKGDTLLYPSEFHKSRKPFEVAAVGRETSPEQLAKRVDWTANARMRWRHITANPPQEAESWAGRKIQIGACFYSKMLPIKEALSKDSDTKQHYESLRRGGKEWLCYSWWISEDRRPESRRIPRFAHLVARLYRHRGCPPV